MLQEIEVCRAGQGALATCKELLSNDEEVIVTQNQRIIELEKDLKTMEEMNRSALDAAKRASGGKWYERIWSAGKFVLVGALVGFAIGAAR